MNNTKHDGIEAARAFDILNILQEYRCRFTVEAEDDFSGLPLEDKLCPPNSKDVHEGKLEMEELADFIEGAIKDNAADAVRKERQRIADKLENDAALIARIGLQDYVKQLREGTAKG